MALYRYEAAAASGELVRGEMDATDLDAVVARLHAQGYVPIRADSTKAGWLSRLLAEPLTFKPRPKPATLVFLTQQLATLLHAGLSLDRALEIGLTMLQGKPERDALAAVLDKVRGGSSFADALAAENEVFPAFYIGMVRSGEASGSLEAALRHLADLLQRAQAAREQVTSALIYPAVVFVTGIGSMAVLFGFVIPRFRPLFEQAGAAIPLATRAILAVSNFLRDDGWLVLALLLGLGLLARQYVRTPEGRARWDRLVLRLPVVGDLATRIEVARFARALGTMLKNGVPPLTALTITQKTIGNAALREALSAVIESVKEGKGFAEPLARTRLFPDLALQLTRIGEETARLDDMLLQTAEIYEQESKRSIDRLLSLLVPGVTILLGVVVAVVIGSILTAVLSVYDLAL